MHQKVQVIVNEAWECRARELDEKNECATKIFFSCDDGTCFVFSIQKKSALKHHLSKQTPSSSPHVQLLVDPC